jgi:HK97 gp10 family phage protein
VTAVRGNSKDVASFSIHVGQAFWGMFLEFGTRNMQAQPFVRPALDAESGRAVREIGKALGRGVEREAKKLAGSYKRARKVF